MKDLMKRRRLAYDAGDAGNTDVDAGRPPRAAGCPEGSAGRRISPTVSADAIAEAQNALEAAQASGDYRFQSVGDLLRAALRAYAGGMRLTQPARGGRKKRHTFALPAELFDRYRDLPSRSRGVIIERALLSFLAQGFEKQGRDG